MKPKEKFQELCPTMSKIDDEKCVKLLFDMKWPGGYICKNCGSEDFYFIKGRKVFECRKCRIQESLTSGTIMHKSRLPIIKWLKAMYLMRKNSNSMSSVKLMESLEISYPSAWRLKRKLHEIKKVIESLPTNHE